MLRCESPSEKLYVFHLGRPIGLSVRTVFALMFRIQCRTPIASQIERKNGDALRGILDMDMLVATDVLCKTMDEEEYGSREGGWVCTRVELVPSCTSEPLLDVVFARASDRLHIAESSRVG